MIPLTLMSCTTLGFPQAFDYHIDRTRVVAVRAWPPHTPGSVPREVDALVLGPYPIARTAVHVCDLPVDDFIVLEGMDCFENDPDRIGDALPAEWVPPDLSALDCPDRCTSTVPVRVTVEDETGALAIGVRHTEVPAVEELLFFSFEEISGFAFRLDVPELADRGDEIELVAVSASSFGTYQWYVGAGVLLATGRTTPHEDIGEDTLSYNTLRIPATQPPGPIRIAVVGTDPILGGGYTTSVWATAEVVIR